MDTNQLPTRSERHKTEENSSQLSAAFVLGTCWILFTLTPELWRSPGTYIVIGIIAIYLSSKLDKFKCSRTVKWTIALLVYVIGFILYVL
ncbi:hypothetical protein ACLZHR_18915 [Priestia aryabhattai]|uniref:Uncharacterized protein n=1 Tax=Priestia megaterium Q3 TaxID=1452722 RepID=A0A806TF81_PRIMG|nr:MULTISPECIES: hypothetical protein [Priestia]MCL9634204.1 hypothetical protein [Bacillus zanthoxyli]AKP76751.1 hypothetical protein AS52_01786 [Priestia megaterium Q3]MED3887829.1 hypothetical protein [Priestia aryabhattai]MED3988067.1 hypothetical protein [Priestia aryabhattai]MED4262073.1 hypothetical protein [Priestia aryabhattai]